MSLETVNRTMTEREAFEHQACINAATDTARGAGPEFACSEWIDAVVDSKKECETLRQHALRQNDKERAEYWEGRRDGINEVISLATTAASIDRTHLPLPA